MREASPASTERLASGDGQAERGYHEMADAESPANGLAEPAADNVIQTPSSNEASPSLGGPADKDEGPQHSNCSNDDDDNGDDAAQKHHATAGHSARKDILGSGQARAGLPDPSRTASGSAREAPKPAEPTPSKHAEGADAAAAALTEPAAEAEAEPSPPPMLTSRKSSKKAALMRAGLLASGQKAQPQNIPLIPETDHDEAAADGNAEHDAPAQAAADCHAVHTADGRPSSATEGQQGPVGSGTPRAASAEDDDMPLSVLAKKGPTPQTGSRSAATPQDAGKGSTSQGGLQGVEKRHGLSSSKRRGQRSSTRLKNKASKHYGEGTPKRSLILSNEQVSSGWKVRSSAAPGPFDDSSMAAQAC